MLATLRDLFRQESGQDLVEYGLLTLFVVLASIVVWQAIAEAIGTAYGGYDSNIQDLALPCDPGVTGPCPWAAR